MPVVGSVQVRDPNRVLPGGFWAAVSVWLEKAQVLNKRLCGSIEGQTWDLGADENEELAALSCPGIEGEDEEILSAISGYGNGRKGTATVRTLIPKANPHYSSCQPRKELVIRDHANRTVTFLPIEDLNRFKEKNIYQIRLKHVADDEWSLALATLYSEGWECDGVIYPKISWMINELLSKLAKWSTEDKKSEFKNTLSLIAVDKYSRLYQSLKEKYKDMVKVWPEVTDPEKFVYEDVAIATYLLILWERERDQKHLAKKQSFVDLGCGNGLLVHILINEGHSGRGIDVRKRKIWEMYGPQTILQESAILPNDDFLFPDTDWIIGNHSDELTPWLPVIAARSSYSCCYFVLPCCFFNFYGKYNRKSSKKTQYREYLDFVKEVGHRCGFNVEEDCLRIPSTKRVCLIGMSRTYPQSEENNMDEERTRYIKSQYVDNSSCCVDKDHCHTNSQEGDHCSQFIPENATSNWISGFQPREKEQPIRNCALLPRDFVDKIVLQVANLLLNSDPERKDNPAIDQSDWNIGRCLTLREVADYLNKDTLQRLKNECGGLQTLLRNNHQVFKVVSSKVSIRDWRQETFTSTSKRKPESKRKPSHDVLKTRLCWFYVNHPDGCPRDIESCPYAHGTEQLRPNVILSMKKNKSKPL
ncbi:hypothetical protein GDO86_000179 [Hymenochirus boettgeri]|uniref:tRNA (uracil-O(2)-)-methyltransferase n=1 Tax=Hymenochirus boettgeri TaxID=247094 RepID=A0A8T2K8B6_9PIPI|nr:hypothetical protein GDO86_000179 [Hymenochirus boettgeri]